MIDNIELIKPLLNFENKDDFYMLYIFKRKKDQPEGEKNNHQSVRTIKTYCISSIDYLEMRYDEIKQLCEMFKARAYIHIQKQRHSDVSLDMMIELAERIKSNVTNQFGLFESVVGQIKTQEKRWIVDIDTKDEIELAKVITAIADSRPILTKEDGTIDSKIIQQIPTKNGIHLITHRFDVMNFKKHFPDVDIQKKNPTLVYFPESLEYL